MSRWTTPISAAPGPAAAGAAQEARRPSSLRSRQPTMASQIKIILRPVKGHCHVGQFYLSMARRAYGPHTAKSMACRVREWRWTPREFAILGRRDKAARQAAEVDATQRAQGSARDLAVAEPGRGGSGDHDIRREIRAQIRQGRRMPDQGSSDAADVLRLSRRSLGPFANLESDRERVRDGETSHRPHEGRAVAR